LARRIESLLLDGPAGKLEALLEEPEDRAPREACILCHPHPLFGGTMHNKVVYRMARALRRSGSVVLRFNFRGVRSSQGEHAGGVGEIDDARTALDWLRGRYASIPYALAGFSFGARVILRLGCHSSDAARLIAAGFPMQSAEAVFLKTCTAPKFLITSTHDQYAPRGRMEALYAGIAEPKQIIWIESRDHFFDGALDRLEETIFELRQPA
jgi:uncharacterized protein